MLHKFAVGDDGCRSKFKIKLRNYFNEQIQFMTPKYKTAKIVIATECLDGGFLSIAQQKLLELKPVIGGTKYRMRLKIFQN